MKASGLTGKEPVIYRDDKSLTAIEGGGLHDVIDHYIQPSKACQHHWYLRQSA